MFSNYNQITKNKININDNNKNDISNLFYKYDNLLNKEKSLKLEEMWNDLINYKNEINEQITNKLSIKYNEFKNTLYSNLEHLIFELSYIDNPQTKKEKIDEIYKWYQDKLNYFYSLSNIQEHTSEINSINLLNKTFEEEKINESIDEDILTKNSHRSQLIQYISIKNYKLKKLNIPKIFNNEKIKQNKNYKNLQLDINDIPKPRKSNKIFKYSFNDGIKFYTMKKNKKEKNYLMKQENKNNEIILPNQELRTSYSCFLPKFSLYKAKIEKKIFEKKQLSIAEKRNLEEIKCALNQFGKQKAIHISNINKQYEYKMLIKHYKKNNQQNKNKINNDIYNINDLSINSSIEKSKTFKMNLTNQFQNVSKFSRGSSVLITKNERILMKKPKVDINNIKNIDNITNEIFPSLGEKILNINLKLSKSKSFNEILKYHKKNSENIPNDSIIQFTSNDSILYTRHLYNKLLNVKEISNIIELNKKKQNLSSFDLFKKNEIEQNNDKNPINNVKSYIRRNYSNFSNYLQLRKSMENYQINEFKNLTHSFIENKINKNIIFKAFVNPKNKKYYPRFFLPKPINNLLVKPFEKLKKK